MFAHARARPSTTKSTINQSQKTFDKKTRTKHFEKKWASSIPTILRDMSPPANSVFNPEEKWKLKKAENELLENMR